MRWNLVCNINLILFTNKKTPSLTFLCFIVNYSTRKKKALSCDYHWIYLCKRAPPYNFKYFRTKFIVAIVWYSQHENKLLIILHHCLYNFSFICDLLTVLTTDMRRIWNFCSLNIDMRSLIIETNLKFEVSKEN